MTLLSAHQSIGVPQPLKLFGTKEQKKKYLPRLAAGAISAFALTEAHVGSDPANLSTTATRDARGRLRPQRREALVHQRHDRRALRRHGAPPGRRRRSPPSSSRSRSPGVEVVHPLPLHGACRRSTTASSASPGRPRAEGEPALGRGQGPEARAHHVEHRPPHAAGLLPPPWASAASRSAASGRTSACSGGCRSGTTTRSRSCWPRWRRRPSRWTRSPTWPRRWPTWATATSASRPPWPRCGTPRRAGRSSTARCRSAAAAATRRRIRCARAARRPCPSSGSCATSAST